MSNVTIGWNNATPTDSDLVGQGDDVIRSIKSNVQAALDAEHFFPAAGGAAGAHRRGSARIYVGSSSQVSSADTDGRMMFNTTTGQLNYLSSTSSTIVGGRDVPHYVRPPSALSRYIAIDSGSATIRTSSSVGTETVSIVYGFSTYVAPPRIFLTLEGVDRGGDNEVYAPVVGEVNTQAFQVYWGGIANNSLSTATLNWLAIGEKAYP